MVAGARAGSNATRVMAMHQGAAFKIPDCDLNAVEAAFCDLKEVTSSPVSAGHQI